MIHIQVDRMGTKVRKFTDLYAAVFDLLANNASIDYLYYSISRKKNLYYYRINDDM